MIRSIRHRIRPLVPSTHAPRSSSLSKWQQSSHNHAKIPLGRPLFSTSSSVESNNNNNNHNDDNNNNNKKKQHQKGEKVASFVGHNFPDFIEYWSRSAFYKVGVGLGASTGILGLSTAYHWDAAASLSSSLSTSASSSMGTMMIPIAVAALSTAAYWKIGLDDMQQTSHAIRRNYPVLGNVRYVLETIRPEIRQYLVESDVDGKPYDRMRRSIIYQRAKNVDDTMSFGTRRDVYATNYEWACHSMWPKVVPPAAARCTIGTAHFGTTQPYSASVLNISGMSYGAISDNAILALSQGAKMGGFYHNTGEGGVSKSHKQGGGDLVWNMGTGYFGCGITDPQTGKRIFDPDTFQETIRESNGQIKMVEIKLSQGAKPGHGGILPKAKITSAIADARKIDYPATGDCHSPPGHSAFSTPHELVEFIAHVRELSGGLPIGIKMCVGDPTEVAALVKAMVELNNGPDFISVDGGEGGTGAAPPEYSDSIGLPLEEGLAVVRNLLVGANMKDHVKLNCSGRVTNGFSVVRMLALGADITCAARAFMMSLGCIQALKCNTNHCPTGIATQDTNLQYGLDPTDKTHRVYHYHRKTIHSAAEIVGTIGRESFAELNAGDIMRRVRQGKVQTLSEYLPEVEPGCLLNGTAPTRLQEIWNTVPDGGGGGDDSVVIVNDSSSNNNNRNKTKRWIY